MADGERVWVVDTSALLDFKVQISVGDQWEAFKHLEDLVVLGLIAMPRQVLSEASELAHPDLPGAWAPGMRSQLRHPLDVDFEHLTRVMAVAGEVVDPSKTREDADPYVAAQALQLRAAGHHPIVVTSDRVDRLPLKIALTTACERLGVAHVSAREFLLAHEVKVKAK